MSNIGEKIKKKINMKKAIKAFTILMGVLLIVVMTAVNVVFDSGKLNVRDYVCNSLILVGIMVFGLIMGESVGEDRQLEKVGGLYQTNMGLYFEARKAMEGDEIYFPQFFQWYKEKRAYSKRLNYLIDHGFEHQWAKAIVDNLEATDIETLTRQSIRKNGVIIKRVTESQAEIVKRLFDGSLALDTTNYSYYLSAHNKANSKDILEQPGVYVRDLKTNKLINRGLKIVSSLFISFLWSTMTVKEFMDAGNAQAWLNLTSRLTAFVTSFLSGWATSVIDVQIKSYIIDNKTEVLRTFKSCMAKGEFVPKSYEESAKEEYEREERERQEAIKAVVTPESVPDLEIAKIAMKEEE